MSNVRALSRDQVLEILRDRMEVPADADDEVVRSQVITEVIRSCLCRLSLMRGEKSIGPAVYTQRIVSAVRRHVASVWPELAQGRSHSPFNYQSPDSLKGEEQFKWHLDRLALLGDVVRLQNGFWLPAPVRLIALPNSSDVAVVGGLATSDLKQFWPEVQAAGYGRVLSGVDFPQSSDVWQIYKNWVGSMPNDLRSWTADQALQTIRSGSVSSGSFIDYDVYVSSWELRRRTPQRWISASNLFSVGPPEPVMLCRTRDRFRYFLGHFRGGRLVRETSVPLEQVRLLQLGLSLHHGLLPLATWVGNSVWLSPPPPRPVERHLLLYAHCHQPRPGEFVYKITPRWASQIRTHLERVGYRIRHKGGLSG